MQPIAHILTDFPTKFGVPRQSGVVSTLIGRIVFLKEYRVPEAFRELDKFSHIWLIWDFSEAHRHSWSPTVRPPRLGGNARVGVFATRSPFRPNNIGLSCVRLLKIDYDSADSPALIVEGIDMMDQTPIYDVKPYIPYADAHPDATAGFTASRSDAFALNVVLAPDLADQLARSLAPDKIAALKQTLANDPRPHYHTDPTRVYVLPFANFEISFQVDGQTLTLVAISPLDPTNRSSRE